MNFFRGNSEIKSLCSIFRLYSLKRKTHYDVLHLNKNCSDKEIKDAFIQMSKEFHPDKNKDAKAQEHFVRIVEAYNILSKPSLRAQYDNTLEIAVPHYGNRGTSYEYKTHVQYNFRNNPHYGFYHETQNSGQKENPDYYGVKGVKKMPNIAIIMICFGVAFIGVFLQVVVIRESYFMHRKTIRETSKKLQDEYDKVKLTAQGKTNEVQSRILLEKIAAGSNSSAATASLGQALAEEEKVLAKSLYTEYEIFDEEDFDFENSQLNFISNLYEMLKKLTSYVF